MDETTKNMIIAEIRENRNEIKKLHETQNICKLKTQDDLNKLKMSLLKIIMLLLASGALGGTASTILQGIIK